eukprot:GHVS01074148.1.p1 GENE.GHVS01074148.1~~GHVS01074148.1.p1  ORF type:complete len:464 (-),score=64.11 GHVS01074148.1:1018-2277(-)
MAANKSTDMAASVLSDKYFSSATRAIGDENYTYVRAAMRRVKRIVASMEVQTIPPMLHQPQLPEDLPSSSPKVIFARLIGNRSFPMQGIRQHARNAEYIINYGPKMQPGEHRLWIINRIIDERERKLIVDVLEKYQEWYLEIPFSVEPIQKILEEAKSPEMSRRLRWLWERSAVCATNQNAARNLSLKVAEVLGYDWTAVLDGNVFLTEEGVEGIRRAIRRATNASKPYIFLPFYRVSEQEDPQRLNDSSTFRELSSWMTGPQECQLLVATNASVLKPPLFPANSQYGAGNKMYVLSRIRKYMGYEELCNAANVGFMVETRDVAEERRLIEQCGYSIRLSYWTDEWVSSGRSDDRNDRLKQSFPTIIKARARMRAVGLKKVKIDLLEKVDLPAEVKQNLIRALPSFGPFERIEEMPQEY